MEICLEGDGERAVAISGCESSTHPVIPKVLWVAIALATSAIKRMKVRVMGRQDVYFETGIKTANPPGADSSSALHLDSNFSNPFKQGRDQKPAGSLTPPILPIEYSASTPLKPDELKPEIQYIPHFQGSTLYWVTIETMLANDFEDLETDIRRLSFLTTFRITTITKRTIQVREEVNDGQRFGGCASTTFGQARFRARECITEAKKKLNLYRNL
ncbi:hypothetical protein DFH27DRAFT_609705 [Peziza echinospora]|nr:hypothetical protein DFH27DRAFT_609705 [Peziza echinospora]